MKPGKRKKTRRTLDFYSLNARFREPYKVMLDGNFIHIALSSGVEDLQGRIADLLSSSPKSPPRLFTTSCVMRELQQMGFKKALLHARDNVQIQRCKHEGQLSPEECIFSTVGMMDGKGYFVGTQDNTLIERLGQKLRVGFIQLTANGMQLLPPSATQQQLVKEALSDQLIPSAQELDTPDMRSLKDSEEKPLSRYAEKRMKKQQRSANISLNRRPGEGKKKRPGPRLRNALKAEAAAKAQEAAKNGEAAVANPIMPQAEAATKVDTGAAASLPAVTGQRETFGKPADKQKLAVVAEQSGKGSDEKAHRKRKRRRHSNAGPAVE